MTLGRTVLGHLPITGRLSAARKASRGGLRSRGRWNGPADWTRVPITCETPESVLDELQLTQCDSTPRLLLLAWRKWNSLR